MSNPLTLSNINRFSQFFHCQNQEKMCNNIITKDPTTPVYTFRGQLLAVPVWYGIKTSCSSVTNRSLLPVHVSCMQRLS